MSNQASAIQEYPKALYKGGEYIAVADRGDEASRRKDGFLDWREDYDRMNGLEAVEEDVVEDEPEAEVIRPVPVAISAPISAPKVEPQHIRAPLSLKK